MCVVVGVDEDGGALRGSALAVFCRDSNLPRAEMSVKLQRSTTVVTAARDGAASPTAEGREDSPSIAGLGHQRPRSQPNTAAPGVTALVHRRLLRCETHRRSEE